MLEENREVLRNIRAGDERRTETESMPGRTAPGRNGMADQNRRETETPGNKKIWRFRNLFPIIIIALYAHEGRPHIRVTMREAMGAWGAIPDRIYKERGTGAP